MELTNEITIAAPRPLVWDVSTAVEDWPSWTPTVTSVQRADAGPFQIGSVAQIKQPGLPNTEWVVSDLTPGESFSWGTRVRGIELKATHLLTDEQGGTRNLLRIEVSGVAGRLLWPLLRGSLARALAQENAGLKQHCEELVTAR